MKSVWTYLKLGIINVGVLLILLLSLNFIASVYLDGKYLYKQIFVPINKKAYRASLEDRAAAIRFYHEKKQLRTRYVPYTAWSRKPFSGEAITINQNKQETRLSECPLLAVSRHPKLGLDRIYEVC